MALAHSEIDAARERVVDAALAIIEDQGGQALTMNELAARAGMAPSNLHRYFETREAVLEKVAERWYQPKIAIMEDVVRSDLPPRRKMYEFFARRFVRSRASFRADPVSYKAYHDIGDEHFAIVEGYIDLADHYLAEIIGEAMGEGHFAGLSVDEALSLVNQMAHMYCNTAVIPYAADRLSEEKLARIVDAIFDGLSAQDRGAKAVKGLRAA